MRCWYDYYAYGLHIRSCFPIPEFLVTKAPQDFGGAPDIIIEIGKVEIHPQHINENGRGFWIDNDQACHYLQGVGAFLISNGKHILVDPQPKVAQQTLRLSLFGPALAIALHQRGLFILHASAIMIKGTAIAFLGGHGYGKSTMAITLYARGHNFITDDVTAINHVDINIQPSFPQLKLWPDTLNNLKYNYRNLPHVHPDIEKRLMHLSDNFISSPQPLQRFYVLGIGTSTAIEKVTPIRAFEEIISHWYGIRFGSTFLAAINLKDFFQKASTLARKIPLRYLKRPATLMNDPRLPQIIENAILADLENR